MKKGPWTKGLRKLLADVENDLIPKPKMLIDGPFGEGHQNWTNFVQPEPYNLRSTPNNL